MKSQQNFGTVLRELRKKAGLTPREPAARVNVNFTYLSKIENGALPPPSEKVIRQLAQVLNYDQDELLALAGVIPPDIVDILKHRQAREKLRDEKSRKEIKASRKQTLALPRVSLPFKGLYRLA